MSIIEAISSITEDRLSGKHFTPFLCLQPGGHLEFLTKLTKVPASSFSPIIKKDKVNDLNYKENRDYQHKYWRSNQDAHDAQNEQYSNPNVKDNHPFTIFLDFERFPLVELCHINAGEIMRSQVLGSNRHGWPPISNISYHLFHNRVNSIRRREGTPCLPAGLLRIVLGHLKNSFFFSLRDLVPYLPAVLMTRSQSIVTCFLVSFVPLVTRKRSSGEGLAFEAFA